MPKLTETVRFTAGDKATLTMGEYAYHSREGNALHRWMDDVTPGAAVSILAGASQLQYPIADGKAVFVTCFTTSLETQSDDCSFQLMGQNAGAPGGWYQMAGHIHIRTGAANAGRDTKIAYFDPPIKLAYSDGYRGIGVQVDANDAGAQISFGWCGWVEDEA